MISTGSASHRCSTGVTGVSLWLALTWWGDSGSCRRSSQRSVPLKIGSRYDMHRGDPQSSHPTCDSSRDGTIQGYLLSLLRHQLYILGSTTTPPFQLYADACLTRFYTNRWLVQTPVDENSEIRSPDPITHSTYLPVSRSARSLPKSDFWASVNEILSCSLNRWSCSARCTRSNLSYASSVSRR